MNHRGHKYKCPLRFHKWKGNMFSQVDFFCDLFFFFENDNKSFQKQYKIKIFQLFIRTFEWKSVIKSARPATARIGGRYLRYVSSPTLNGSPPHIFGIFLPPKPSPHAPPTRINNALIHSCNYCVYISKKHFLRWDSKADHLFLLQIQKFDW